MRSSKQPTEPVLDVEHLSFSYRKGGPLLRDVTFSLSKGERVLILAPFGAGKTTLARILSALTPRYFNGKLGGSVRLNGTSLKSLKPWDLLKKVGYLSQNPIEQSIASVVEDELAFPLESLGEKREIMHARVKESLSRWSLSDYAQIAQSELSGGERKRVLLALTGMLDPELYLLDESFDDLDIVWRDFLVRMIEGSDRTFLVFSSRFLSRFETLFDRVFLLDDGVLREAESASDAKKQFDRMTGNGSVRLPAEVECDAHHVLKARSLSLQKSREGDLMHRVFSLSVPSFSLHSGEVVTLSGLNGSGKSTFARLACGLEEAQKGSFFYDGKPVTSGDLNRITGYLFQNPDLQIFLPTVRDELKWSLTRSGKSDSECERLVIETCELFGLNPDDTPTTMSYPEKKALQGGVYYLLDRPFYILDEIDNSLTYKKAARIVSLLRRNGAGVMIITHDENFASLVEGRSYVVENHKVVERG